MYFEAKRPLQNLNRKKKKKQKFNYQKLPKNHNLQK